MPERKLMKRRWASWSLETQVESTDNQTLHPLKRLKSKCQVITEAKMMTYERLRAALWVLGTQLGSSARAVSALNH